MRSGSMSQMGQNRKSSMRANVFRCSPNNGHRQGTSACPFRAKTGSEARSFDRLVRAGEKGRRGFDTERFRRLEINDKQEFGGLLNRKLGWFGAFQNSIDIVSPKSSQGGKVRPVRNQSARLRK